MSIAVVGGCGRGPGGYPSQSPSTGRPGIVDTASVDELLDAIAKTGVPMANRRDVTSKDCPSIGCVQRVETDTVTITRFPTSGHAQVYAGDHGRVYQIVDVVLSFPESATSDVQQRCERAVESLIE